VNSLKFKQIIYLISATVVVTVAAQVYNNVQNYRINKQRFELDVQQALDLAVETYYADRAKNDLVIFTSSARFSDSLFMDKNIEMKGDFRIDTTINLSSPTYRSGPAWKTYLEKRDSIRGIYSTVSITSDSASIFKISPDSIQSIEVLNHVDIGDSIKLQLMAKKILASLTDTGLDFEQLEEYLKEELNRKDIDVDFALIHTTPRNIYSSNENDYELASFSKSTYLPRDQTLEIRYENASLAILKRGAFDLFISLLIIAAVVSSLLYLYRVINEQKQLAEIKNDLISNITHEFKTPIATISTAIEGISMFNQANDPAKTKKYLGISSDQLKKLNNMVEKLLETATLDSDDIELSLESADVVHMTRKVVEKFDLVKGSKTLNWTCELTEKWVELDFFHMENAISNLIDNALKYGGDQVTVRLKEVGGRTLWEVTDNGASMDKQQQARIFEKFYRVPKGNVHDVKGFGIGLYYTKAMVEKHGGEISLNVSTGETKFRIII